jgi:hypothetical protein
MGEIKRLRRVHPLLARYCTAYGFAYPSERTIGRLIAD